MGECNTIDCHEAATHEVVLVLPSADGSPPSEGPLGIHLCADCADETKAWTFDSIQWAIEAMMREAGFPDPDVSKSYAKPIPIRAEVLN